MNGSMTRSSTGVLAAAEERLAALVARAEHLADETAWECAAARAYRAELGEWVAQVHHLRADVEGLERTARAALALAAGAGR